MSDFFHDGNTERLWFVAASWLGTPFMFNGKVKQSGVSCQHLPIEIYRECGMEIDFTPLAGTGGAADQEKENRMSEFIEKTGRFARVENDGDASWSYLRPGDLLTFRVVAGEYHLGLYTHPRFAIFLHTIRPYGVSYSNLYDPTYGERFLTAWRPQA